MLIKKHAHFPSVIQNVCIFHSPFFDAVVFASSSLTDEALHELGLSDEYSLIGVVDCGDMMLVVSGFAESFALMLPASC
jgi:hypothetical protein